MLIRIEVYHENSLAQNDNGKREKNQRHRDGLAILCHL